MQKHFRKNFRILVILLALFLLLPQAVTLAVGGILSVALVTPSPQTQFTNATFSAHAEWFQGVDQIRYYVNSDPNGGSNGSWWEFANTACNNVTICNTSATINYSNRPFSLHGTHLIAVNAVLSANATGGDVFGYIDCCLQRWLLIWTVNQPQRTKTFQWNGALGMGTVTPPSAEPDGTNVTFAASATWDEGVDQIRYYVNSDPNGGTPTNGWQQFAIAYCNNVTNCTIVAVSRSLCTDVTSLQ